MKIRTYLKKMKPCLKQNEAYGCDTIQVPAQRVKMFVETDGNHFNDNRTDGAVNRTGRKEDCRSGDPMMKTATKSIENNEHAPKTTVQPDQTDRRGMAKTMLAATAAGLGLARVPAQAQTTAPLRIGVNNNAGSSATSLAMTNTATNAFVVSNSGTGAASAVWGIGNGASKIGLFGLAQAGGFAAVLARAENSQYGIVADTDNGSSAGGVFGNSGGGAALVVQGRIMVANPGGSGVVPPTGSVMGLTGQTTISVRKAFIKTNSIVLVSMIGNPGSSACVQWIELIEGTGFGIHLTRALGADTTLLYMIIEQS